MMTFTKPAQIFIAILCAVLLIPVLGIPSQDMARLETFHNRVLTKWPASSSFIEDPAAYLAQARKWLSDRGYPTEEATSFYKRVELYVLRTPPERRITMGPDGFIFLNGASDDKINNILDSVCIYNHKESVADTFKKSLPAIASYSSRIKTPIDVVIFPTLQTVYGDYLPLSVPLKYREACAARSRGESPMIRAQQSANPLVVFPMREMTEARNDPAFFPKGNWHPRGLSITTVRDAYLKHIGANRKVNEILQLTTEPSELMATYNIDWQLPAYKVINSALDTDTEKTTEVDKVAVDLFDSPRRVVRAYKNKTPIVPETVLMISDSFGDSSAPVFAGAFRQLIHVTTNGMDDAKVTELIRRISSVEKLDRIIMLVQESNTPRIVGWSEAMASPSKTH